MSIMMSIVSRSTKDEAIDMTRKIIKPRVPGCNKTNPFENKKKSHEKNYRQIKNIYFGEDHFWRFLVCVWLILGPMWYWGGCVCVGKSEKVFLHVLHSPPGGVSFISSRLRWTPVAPENSCISLENTKNNILGFSRSMFMDVPKMFNDFFDLCGFSPPTFDGISIIPGALRASRFLDTSSKVSRENPK